MTAIVLRRPVIIIPLLLCLAASAPSCGPVLRASESFTPERVREIKYNDRCQLQPYFDTKPPKLARHSELIVSEDLRQGLVHGQVTFQLVDPIQRQAFIQLLDRQYQRLPQLNPDAPVVATVPFLRRKGRNEHLPINAEVQVEAGERHFWLPYSPCVSAFFYGRGYYGMRRKLRGRR